MKLLHLAACGLLAAAFAPTVSSAAEPLIQSAVQRQQIMELEYLLNEPGLPPAEATRLQGQAMQLQDKINGPDLTSLNLPVYGSCEADDAMIAYLQDEMANSNLDYQSHVIFQRAIRDLEVNISARGC
jgi:hypothetical protein